MLNRITEVLNNITMQGRLERKQRVYFFSLLIMSLLYVFPIILADRYYNDDLGRAVTGYTGWNGDGRPAADFFMRLLNFGRPINDTFPLSLILGIIVFAYVMTLYIKYTLDINTPMCFLYAGFLVLANPFFIPNLSYQYDSVLMLLSISLPLLAFSIPFTNIIAEILINFFLVTTTMCLFQPSIGVWLSLLFLEVILAIIKKKSFVRRFIFRGVGGVIAVVTYVFFIAPSFVDRQGWRAEASKLSLSPHVIIANFKRAFEIIIRFCDGLTLMIFVPVVGLTILAIIAWIVEIYRNNAFEKRCQKILVYFYVSFLPVILVASAILPLTVLATGRISDHVLPGIGVALLFVGIGLTFCKKKVVKTAIYILLIPCVLFQYVYIFAYGNAMESQKNYETRLVQSIVNDIESIDVYRECEYIDIQGKMPKSRQLMLACDKYPQFNSIIPTYLFPENWIGTMLLNHYADCQLSWEKMDESERKALGTMNPVKETSVYALYRIGNKIVVSFKTQ